MTERIAARSGVDVLDRALDARKVAVFGASAAPEKMGYILCRDLLAHGFAGELVFVNRRGGNVCGHPMTADPSDAAGADFAIVATPAGSAPDIVATCGELGIPLVIVGAGGFAEEGNIELQQRLVETARRHSVRLIGPNCMGFHVSCHGLALASLPFAPTGPVSLICQSGGVAIQAGLRLQQLGSGFDAIVQLGNKVDLGFTDALQVLARRATTDAILMYLEDYDEGEPFFEALNAVRHEIPVVALVGGETSAGAGATRSHTGSMLSSWSRLAGMLEDCGVHVARTANEAYAAAAAGRRRWRPQGTPGGRILVLCHGGAYAVMLVDALSKAGYTLSPLSPELADALSSLIGFPVENPVEFRYSIESDYSLLGRTLERALAAHDYDGVVIGGGMGGFYIMAGEAIGRTEEEAARQIGESVAQTTTPVIVWTTYAALSDLPALEQLRHARVPYVEWPEEAAAALSVSLGPLPRNAPGKPPGSPARSISWDDTLGTQTDRVVDAFEAHGVPQGIGRVVEREDLETIADGRWVLRLDGFAHKTDVGAIEVNISSDDLREAYDRLVTVARDHAAEPAVRLAPLFEYEHELLVTFWRDPRQGNGWALGAGGVDVEREADLSVGRWPRTDDDVRRMLARTNIGRVVLNADATMLAETVRVILGVASAFEESLADVTELECNPVATGAVGVFVLDALPSTRPE